MLLSSVREKKKKESHFVLNLENLILSQVNKTFLMYLLNQSIYIAFKCLSFTISSFTLNYFLDYIFIFKG
jgi:hypothetical protein